MNTEFLRYIILEKKICATGTINIRNAGRCGRF